MGASAAVLTMAALVAVALWVTLRLAAVADLAVLPGASRRHLAWWQGHAAAVYVGCAVAVPVAAAVALLG